MTSAGAISCNEPFGASTWQILATPWPPTGP